MPAVHGLHGVCAVFCPNCRTAELVRASVLEQGFWTNLIQITLPLLVLGVISALLYRIGLPAADRELDGVNRKAEPRG